MIKDNLTDYQLDGNNYNSRLVVHLPEGICRTLISSNHSGNEPKVIVNDKRSIFVDPEKN